MNSLRSTLDSKLKRLPGIEVAAWKDTELICVFYNGRDFAHFHENNILDIRLSTKIIREEKLNPMENSQNHPKRSKNSRWIEIEFQDEEDVEKILHLVKRACNELM